MVLLAKKNLKVLIKSLSSPKNYILCVYMLSNILLLLLVVTAGDKRSSVVMIKWFRLEFLFE